VQMTAKLPFRQVHLDFHTSEYIPGIGERFDKAHWQKTLQTAGVESITCFASCHHGWSYYDTTVGKKHPNLKFDLLRAQFNACREIGIRVPVYLTAGVHNVAISEHPEWRETDYNGQFLGWSKNAFDPGFQTVCFNTPYVDYLAEQIREVVTLFPDAAGIFLDIIAQGQCCCKWCMELMACEGLNPELAADRLKCADLALLNYFQKSTAAARFKNPDMPVFHNSGHVPKGRYDLFSYFSHFELESLPTGGWGYDHFPLSAKYCQQLGIDFLGMTGKFHTAWGEFGGYKPPDALRYECGAMIAHGAKCSVGDQLHPSGRLDESTYRIIGAAFAEVEQKQPWCTGAKSVADIGLLSSEAVNRARTGGHYDNPADTGAARILLEGHFLFDVIDSNMDFRRYKMLILPDDLNIQPALQKKLNEYLAGGGKLFMTGTSGIDENGFMFDTGAEWLGAGEFEPDYILPAPELQPAFCSSPFVMYRRPQRIKVTGGESLGDLIEPYFNRTWEHFCSHLHTPPQPEISGFSGGVQKDNILYLAHPVFSIYHDFGAVTCKEYIVNALNRLLSGRILKTNLPSVARAVLTFQPAENRHVLHLLYSSTVQRGSEVKLSNSTESGKLHGVELIEELIPLHNIKIEVELPENIRRATLQPEGMPLAFTQTAGRILFTVPQFTGHQMIELAH